MNRLVIIGNGFDLAHGLKTSYLDFINDYWKDGQSKLISAYSRAYRDEILSIDMHDYAYRMNKINSYSDFKQEAKISQISYQFVNLIFGQMSNRSITNWVDIELLYYQNLIDTFVHNKSRIYTEIEVLNKDFLMIKKMLLNYLLKIDTNCELLPNFILQLNSPIKLVELKNSIRPSLIEISNNSTIPKRIKTQKEVQLRPSELFFLNFNYTQTLEKYKEKLFQIDQTYKYLDKNLINIHGSIDSKKEIVFGYGDEMDIKYQEIENLKDNRYFENIKSFAYLQDNKYSELVSLINSDYYQIVIFGHSCGVSDRTLLNTLFEHPNCVSIKPYYYKRKDGSDNYTEIIQNISRHFTDKQKMREVVVNKEYTEPFSIDE